MRITGGQAKGRTLAPLKGLKIRPTSDQVREAIFSILGQDLQGTRVLDLFAGTGSLGLEALSRRAKTALFIDHAPRAIALIKKNLTLCGFDETGLVLKKDLRRGIPLTHPFVKAGFDLVFLDPPYGGQLVCELLEHISAAEILDSKARVVAEVSRNETLPVSIRSLAKIDTRSYGDTKISIYACEEIT
jgi:16S rRNA (guanine966-N2)-methyltransferase